MSVPTLHFEVAPPRPSAVADLRLRLNPAHRPCGSVQGAWWPRSHQLTAELSLLLDAVSPRLGRCDRVIYDENGCGAVSLGAYGSPTQASSSEREGP